MKQISFRSFVLLLAALVALAGCTPAASVPAVDPASNPVPGKQSGAGANALPAAATTPEVTPDTASEVEASPRLIFSVAALAQPVALNNGLYRVGAIEVTGSDMPNQALDIVMDQPNSEWAQLPLGTDDMNFDGKPDLVVTQPVGAKWGRLHVWLYESSARRFITNTLTAELGQLVVGSYRLDPATKTLRITNALGMTPFEAAYRTAEGYLMPVLTAAVPADAGACPTLAQGMQLLRQEQHGYCLLYPEGFEARQPIEDEVVIGPPGSEGYGAQVFIKLSASGRKTVDQVADELVAPFTRLTPTPGHENAVSIRRGRGTLAGEPAVILDGVPGQDLRRMVLVIHGERLYEFTFVPADRGNEAYTQMEALFAAVTRSLRFAGTVATPSTPATGVPSTPSSATGNPATGATPQLVFASARSGHLELWALPLAASTMSTTETSKAKPRQLTHGGSWNGALAATPDGTRVAYVSETRNTDGSPADREIYLLTLDGSQPINLTQNPALDFYPAWSPDGKQLAFVSNRGGDRYVNSIYVLDVPYAAAGGGSSAARLIAANAAAPAWSPDGRQIAFISDRDTPGQSQVYVTSASGGDQRRVTDGRKTGNGAGVGRPAWSPDGTKLAVPTDWEGNREIYLVPIEPGGQPVNLTRSPGYDDFPAWSPDGKQLAFISDRAGRPSLFVADADGTNVRALAPGLTAALGSWSPDGRRLAFVGAGDDLNQEIYVVNGDGTNLMALTDDPAQDTSPVWAVKSSVEVEGP